VALVDERRLTLYKAAGSRLRRFHSLAPYLGKLNPTTPENHRLVPDVRRNNVPEKYISDYPIQEGRFPYATIPDLVRIPDAYGLFVASGANNRLEWHLACQSRQRGCASIQLPFERRQYLQWWGWDFAGAR